MLLKLALEDVGEVLIGCTVELVADEDFVIALKLRFGFDGGVQVEEDGQEYFLFGVEHLVFEAEALDLVEVERGVLWLHLVD